MTRGAWIGLALCAIVAAAVAVAWTSGRQSGAPERPADAQQVRQALLAEIQPVKLANCELRRFGEPNDGGYLLCGNLLSGVEGAYSYGISGYDGWGCDISRLLNVTVHQYDCFDLTLPVCEGGRTVFHGECIGTATAVTNGRPYDTLERQIARNGDASRRLVVKMDVEGAEWASFIESPAEVLNRIDQLVVEFHGSGDPRYLAAMRRLKEFFYVAHLHWNNYSCSDDHRPFPAWAYEVLLVNKRIAVADPPGAVTLPHSLDRPNDPGRAECTVP